MAPRWGHGSGVVASAPAAVGEFGGTPAGYRGEVNGRGPRSFGGAWSIRGDEVPNNKP